MFFDFACAIISFRMLISNISRSRLEKVERFESERDVRRFDEGRSIGVSLTVPADPLSENIRERSGRKTTCINRKIFQEEHL